MDAWQLLTQQAAEWGLTVDPTRLERLRRFYDLLLAGNQKANLTRITDEREAVVKHFLDSLSVLRAIDPDRRETPTRFLDVGAGPGFPGIPLLIMEPAWNGTMLEATRKKVDFMNESIAELALSGAAIHGRAEEFGQDPAYRASFDLVVARAVAELNVLAELCLPFVKPGGRFVAMKGSSADEELSRATRAFKTLGGTLVETVRFSLPEGYGDRALVVVEKTGQTPNQYPRRAGQPSAKPLC